MAVGGGAGRLGLRIAALTTHKAVHASAGCMPAVRYLTQSASPAVAPSVAAWKWALAPGCAVPLLGGVRGFAKYPPHTRLEMPSLSPTMSQGNLTEWRVAEGGEIGPGQSLAEVETDKATMEWESQEEGYMAKILVPSGTKDIPVGTLVAIVVDDKDEVAAFKDYSTETESSSAAPAAESAAPAEPEAAAPKAAGSFPPHTMLDMPALSPTMSQGNIVAWNVKVGDTISAGDTLAEVETDKATMGWESQEEGFIAAILVPDGAKDLEIGMPLAVMVDEESDIAAFKSFTAEDAAGAGAGAPAAPAAPTEPKASTQVKEPQQPQQPQPVAQSSGGRVVASPYARKLAREGGVDVGLASGSGPDGRIVAADVQQLIKSGGGKPAARGAPAAEAASDAERAVATKGSVGGYRDVPNSNIRKITAQRLLESKQTVPHYYLTVEARVDKLLALRTQINESLAASGEGKLSVNDFVIKASALALRSVSDVNASWQGEFIRHYDTVDISIAVQTPVGLMVPIVRDADNLGLLEINSEVKSLAKKAKDGKLAPAEFTGGTFTISNLGMYGIDQFAAIINPPQSAILAVGTTSSRVVVGKDGSFEAASIMKATLSADHRVVDGAMGAQWLQAFKGYIEDPLTMLL